ncbi:hypothetical protein CYMTET_31107 [Cymbomonas tetramitiformis]|uniref:ADP-ribosylglycohydrolase n=1 Tax=Cymbomonas tetramitiformis TaxID=36881 RepID=A0AAE0KT86_9CHLO|nr:hypothetical protein CYMTET_31107 [Cymbomonas tetramitiformis]
MVQPPMPHTFARCKVQMCTAEASQFQLPMLVVHQLDLAADNAPLVQLQWAEGQMWQCPCVARSANYTEAVRENILAGGDNCSRAALIGACFAAAYGLDSIPTDWHQAVNRFDEIAGLAADLVESRTSTFHDSSTSAT